MLPDGDGEIAPLAVSSRCPRISATLLRMSEIVNLRQARKRKARTEKETAAAVNRAKFGRTKGEQWQTDSERAKAARDLSGKHLPGKRD